MGAPLLAVGRAPGLDGRLDDLLADVLSLWQRLPDTAPALGPRTRCWQRLRTARHARRLLDELTTELAAAPADAVAQQAWRTALHERIQRFGERRLGWPAGYRRLLFGDELFAVSIAFVRQARATQREIALADAGQALRNVWIGNSLQTLLGLEVRLTPGLFAYSMLYPLTDNVLDDPALPPAAKRALNERLGRRLAGLPVMAAGEAEARIFAMVARIEAELPRARFPDVFASLLAIHHGQEASLRQHDRTPLDDETLLALSFAKGGASVLADLYLVKPAPSVEEERFAFGYGALLQLLDDLQDVAADLAAGHQTLFTRAAVREPLDRLTARLARFVDAVLDEALPPGAQLAQVEPIRRNCRALLVLAVADEPARFTRRFRRRLTTGNAVGLRAVRRLWRRAERRGRGAVARLVDARGVASPLDLLSP